MRKFLGELAITAVPYLLLLGALAGRLLQNEWLFWGSVIPLACLLAFVVAFGVGGGVYLPFYTKRKWKTFSRGEKVLFLCSTVFVLLCLGGIVLAWIVTRR